MDLRSTEPLVKMNTRNTPGGKGGRCVRLTTSPTSRAECHEIWETKPPGTLWATPGLLRDCFTFTSHIHSSISVKFRIGDLHNILLGNSFVKIPAERFLLTHARKWNSIYACAVKAYDIWKSKARLGKACVPRPRIPHLQWRFINMSNENRQHRVVFMRQKHEALQDLDKGRTTWRVA
jgi:hypothetical protein